jgi:hypothetical protein
MPQHVDLGAVNIDELSEALQDQQDYEHWWTFDPRTCEFGYRSRYDPDYDEDEEPDPELIVIEPYPSRVWYQDMVDFAEELSDEHAARRLFRALDGRGALSSIQERAVRRVPGARECLAGVPNSACAPACGRVAARRRPDRRSSRRAVGR